MRDKKNTQNLSVLINKLIRSYGLESQMQELDILSQWEEIVGKIIAKHTTDLKLKNKTLIITVNSSTIKQELLYSRARIIELVNEKTGKILIEEVFIK